jgi:hypothetical protein
MRKQIVVSLILIVIGILLGFFVVVNWQLKQEIDKTVLANNQDSQELAKIENYLQANYLATTTPSQTPSR